MAKLKLPFELEKPSSNEYVTQASEIGYGGIPAACGLIYDISVAKAVNNVPAQYESLSAALGTNGANIPQDIRRGGMSIKFIQSSDNKYVQYRLMADEWSTTVADWQGVDDEPTAGSENLVKSGGVADSVSNAVSPLLGINIELAYTSATQRRAYLYGDFKSGDKVRLWADGTGASSNIVLRYDDITTNIVTLTNNATPVIVELTQDTEFIVALLNDVSVATEGTFVVHADYGYKLRLEDAEAKLSDVDNEPTAGSEKLVESGGVKTSTNRIVARQSPVPNDTYFGIVSVYYPLAFNSMVLKQYYNRTNPVTSQRIVIEVTLPDGTIGTYYYNVAGGDVRTGVETIVIPRYNAQTPDVPLRLTVDWQTMSNGDLNVAFNKDMISVTRDEISDILKGYKEYSDNMLRNESGVFAGYLTSSGSINDDTSYKTTGFIPTQGIKTLFIPAHSIGGSACHLVYDKDKNIIQTISVSSVGSNVVISREAAFIRISEKGVMPIVIDYYDDAISSYSEPIQETVLKAKFVRAGITDIIEDVVFDIKGFLLSDGTINYSNETEYRVNTKPIRVFGGKTYSFTGTLSGSACFIVYDINGIVRKAVTSSDTLTAIEMPYNAYYMRLSINHHGGELTCTSDIVEEDYEIVGTEDKTLADFTYDEVNGKYVFNNGNLLSGTFRLACEFKINGYAEITGNYPIANVGGLEFMMRGEHNLKLTYTDVGNTSTYPIPKRNISFRTMHIARNTPFGEFRNIGLPLYREIIGEDVLRIKYVGTNANNDIDSSTVQTEYATLHNKLLLSFTDGTLHIWADNTTYINTDLSNYGTIGAMVEYLNTVLTDFNIEILGDKTTLISDLANITEVCLVSQFKRYRVDSTDARYDAFYCYFQKKIDESTHIFELVADKGQVTAVVDGEPIAGAKQLNWIVNPASIILGSNGDCPIVPTKVELNMNHFGDAEPQTNGRIVSKYNPSVIVLMGHPIYHGTESDGKVSIFEDETPTSNQAAVIPVIYRTEGHIVEWSKSTASSDVRIRRIIDMANNRGYEFVRLADMAKINDGTLPKRCFAWCFDDEQQFFFDDLYIHSAFSYGGNTLPTLAIEYHERYLSDANYLANQAKLDRAKWECVMHGLDAVNVSTMSSTELYDITSVNSNNNKMFHKQVETANKFLDWTTWVYSNGSANPNTIKAFEHQGVKCGFMTTDLRVKTNNIGFDGFMPSRASNKYFIIRQNIAERISFEDVIEKEFV